jgi:two-component system, chemotaxis family, chemotaxis protein CheY
LEDLAIHFPFTIGPGAPMEPLTWNPRWELGDEQLDGQHRAMLDAMNDLMGAVGQDQEREGTWKALSFLLMYVHTHFREEEGLMEKLAYPHLEEHRAKHAACARQIDGLLANYRTGGRDTLPQLVSFFQFWLTDHFQTADRMLGTFLKTQEKQARPRLRTLIVEDDALTRTFLQAILSAHGPCDVAADGPGALVAFQAAARSEHPYGLVCLDINLPGMDGHRVLASIRATEEIMGIQGLERTRVFMTTASRDPRDVRSAFHGECDSYLMKPIKQEKLQTLLEESGCLAY